MDDGAGPLFGTAYAAAGWPSNATRALAALVRGLSIASDRKRRPLPEALARMEALLGAAVEKRAAGGEEAVARPAPVVVGGASPVVSRPPASSSRGSTSMPPVREDEGAVPDAGAAASSAPREELTGGGEVTRMVRQLELGDADAPLAQKRERVTQAYDSMMLRLERAYAVQGHATLPTGEQELHTIDLLAPRHLLGRLNGLAHTLRKWWNAATFARAISGLTFPARRR